MTTFEAFGKSAYAVIALVLPFVWLAFIWILWVMICRSAKEIDKVSQQPESLFGSMIAKAANGVNVVILAIAQTILFMILLFNLFVATVPYIRGHWTG